MMNEASRSARAPAITLITICRNIAPEIARTLQSILEQTEQSFEWIVVDGASTDGTTAILREKAGHRINTLISEPDGGIFEAMNKGLRHATGSYVAFLNGGDAFHGATSLAECVPFIGLADVIYGGTRIVFGNKTRLFHPAVDPVRPAYFFRSTIPHPGTWVRRSLFERLGGFDESCRIISDRTWFYRAAQHHATFLRMPQIVVDFHKGGASTTPANVAQGEAEIRRFLLASFPVRFLIDSIIRHLQRLYGTVGKTIHRLRPRRPSPS
jgi:glycosyltransferase involved in cell wall biosynthesis